MLFVFRCLFFFGGFVLAEEFKVSEFVSAKDLVADYKYATFAGGCFWCMEPPFERLEGVLAVVSGYTDGKKKNPSYEEVSKGETAHTEAIRIVFDPLKITFAKLVDVYWRQIDPTTLNRQFADKGNQYRSGIYYHSEEQKLQAEKSKDELQKSKRYGDKKIVTEIKKATAFYSAEQYHQDYYKKNPIRYKSYRHFSGRDQFLKKVWDK